MLRRVGVRWRGRTVERPTPKSSATSAAARRVRALSVGGFSPSALRTLRSSVRVDGPTRWIARRRTGREPRRKTAGPRRPRPAPPMMVTLWATTSCASRAIRARCSATRARASASPAALQLLGLLGEPADQLLARPDHPPGDPEGTDEHDKEDEVVERVSRGSPIAVRPGRVPARRCPQSPSGGCSRQPRCSSRRGDRRVSPCCRSPPRLRRLSGDQHEHGRPDAHGKPPGPLPTGGPVS